MGVDGTEALKRFDHKRSGIVQEVFAWLSMDIFRPNYSTNATPLTLDGHVLDRSGKSNNVLIRIAASTRPCP